MGVLLFFFAREYTTLSDRRKVDACNHAVLGPEQGSAGLDATLAGSAVRSICSIPVTRA